MSYSKNPYLPRVRAKAVSMVKTGKGVRLVSRYFGVNASTVSRWLKKSRLTGSDEIPTLNSRPKRTTAISREIRELAIKFRSGRTYKEVIKKLAGRGVKISLSSLKRIMKIK